MSAPVETVEVAAANAARRWRFVAVGLGIVIATNLANAAMNAAQLRDDRPVICVAAINDPDLARRAMSNLPHEPAPR